MALTDHGSMYGVIPFYAAAKNHHMTLLAKDDVGYRNLLALTTAAHLDGYYYKPRIDKELLARHSRGLRDWSRTITGSRGSAQPAAWSASSLSRMRG